MIYSEELLKYIEYLHNLKNDPLDELYKKQKEQNRPIIHKSVAYFFGMLVKLTGAKNILEIGMNAGYSAISMARFLPEDGILTSIDYRADQIEIAKENFKQYDVYDKITTVCGYAQEVLKDIDGTFDIIFIDADKTNMKYYLDYACEHISNKGIILIDNLLWKGSVYTDKEVKHKEAVKEFNEYFAKKEGIISQILPVGDGLGMAILENS